MPKFNSPETKKQLTEFASGITPDCGIPEINFNADGIARHIENFLVNSDDIERIKQHPARFVILIPHDFVKGSFMCPWKLLVNASFEQLCDSFVL